MRERAIQSASPQTISGGSPFLTVKEAAELLRCDHKTVRRAIDTGELEAMFTSRWLIAQSDAFEWARRRAERRRGDIPAASGPERLPRRPRRTDEGAQGSFDDLMAIGKRKGGG